MDCSNKKTWNSFFQIANEIYESLVKNERVVEGIKIALISENENLMKTAIGNLKTMTKVKK